MANGSPVLRPAEGRDSALVKRTGARLAASYDDARSGVRKLEVANYTGGVRIIRLFRPYRGRLAAVLALIAVSATLGIASPFLLRAILDEAIPEQDTTLLAWLVAGMVATSI